MNKLIIICGLSFSGKSTLGKAIAERFEYAEVDVDQTKVALHGWNVKDETLSREQWIRIYEETDKKIVALLTAGTNVVDASRNFARRERNQIRTIVNVLGYEVITVYINTPEPIARQRWQANRKYQYRRDITDKDFEDILRAMEPPTDEEHPLVFDYQEDIEEWISKHIHKLR